MAERNKLVDGAIGVAIILICFTSIAYLIAPIGHSVRGFITIILLDILIVLVMYYIATYHGSQE